MALTLGAVFTGLADAAPDGICDYECESTGCVGSTYHKNVFGEKNNGPSHGCINVDNNPCPHATCASSLTPSELQVLLVAVAANDAESMRAFLRRSQVSLNARRAAIQVAGCTKGSVLAHIPLTASQVGVLDQ